MNLFFTKKIVNVIKFIFTKAKMIKILDAFMLSLLFKYSLKFYKIYFKIIILYLEVIYEHLFAFFKQNKLNVIYSSKKI